MQEQLANTFGSVIRCRDERLLDLDQGRVIDAFISGGVVLFRGFDMDIGALDAFTNRFSGAHYRHPAPRLRPYRNAEGTLTEVLVGNHAIDLHGEMFYLPNRPEVVWFYCELPPSSGGATTLCSGIDLWTHLRPDAREFFAHRKVKYRITFGSEAWTSMGADSQETAYIFFSRFPGLSEVTKIGSDRLRASYVTSAVVAADGPAPLFINSILSVLAHAHEGYLDVTMDDGSPIPEEHVAAIGEASTRAAYHHQWKTNDLLMIDNRRVLHGRDAFPEGTARRVVTRFSMLNDALRGASR